MASIATESQIRELEDTKSCHGTRNMIKYSGIIDLVLRVNLFVTTLAPVILLATSKQTVFVKTPFPPYGASASAKFTDITALIYALAALSVVCLYSIVTALLSMFVLMKKASPSTKLMISIFVMDSLLLGIVAATAGAVGEAGYIGLRGVKRARWQKICNVLDTFCLHVGLTVISAILAGVTLISLVVLCIFKLSPKNNN